MSDHDRTNPLPLAQNTAKDVARVGEDALSAEATSEHPEIGELGAEDIISDADADDGATQIMTRDQAPPSVKKPALSSLDALAMTIPAKGRTMPPSHVPGKKVPPMPPMKAAPPPPPVAVAPPVVAAPPPPPAAAAAAAAAAPPIPSTLVSAQTPVPAESPLRSKTDTQPTTPRIPKAPNTAKIVDLDDEDLVTRIDRTQPFDRNKIFGAPATSPNPNEAHAARPPSSPPPAVNPAAPPGAMTQPSAAWRPAPLPRDLAPVSAAPTTAPTPLTQTLSQPHRPQSQALPSVMVAEPTPAPQHHHHHRPASIAPIAIDIATPTPASHFVPEPAAVGAMHPAYKPPMNQTHILGAAIAGGVALCAAAIIAIVAVSSSSDDQPSAQAKSTPTVAVAPPKPREAQKGTARSAVIETPETTPSRVAAPLAVRDEDGTPVSSPGALPSAPGSRADNSSSHSSSSSLNAQPAEKPEKHSRASAKAAKAAAAAQPASTPEPAAAPPPPVAAAPAPPPPPARPAGPAPTTGVIEVPATLMTVMVDGDYRRVQSGRIVVSCGRHRVNAGRGTQNVDVPCGGAVSVN